MPLPGKKRKSKSKKNDRSVNPGSAIVSYNGPTRMPGGSQQNDTYTSPAQYNVALTSSVIGEILNVFGSSPSSCHNWNSFAALYDEFRTLSIEVHYVPYDRYNRGTTVYTSTIVVATDQDDIVPFTNYDDALDYGSSSLLSLDTPWKRVVKMRGIENSVWTTTATPVNFFCVKLYASGLSNSTAYGRVVVYYLLQFRGRN